MPQKQKSRSWSELKQAGNECFKTGQYGEAVSLYSQAIKELEKSGEVFLFFSPHLLLPVNIILLRCTFRDVDASQVSSFVAESHSVTV